MRLFCCFPKRKKASKAIQESDRNPHNPSSNSQLSEDSFIPPREQILPPPQPPRPPVAVSNPVAKKSNAVKINSALEIGDIAVYDYTPTSTFQGKFRYSCPVCLRYFSHMLITACCANYLCYFCADDLTEKTLHFEVRCPHCNATPIVLSDVEPGATVKVYSDSPQATFKRTGGKFRETAQLEIVVEGNRGDQCESDEERAQDNSALYAQFASTV